MKNNGGMVLMTVLWVVLIVSLIAFSLASTVRVEAVTVQNSFDSERAFFMAKGAAEVVFNGILKKQNIAPEDSPIQLENDEYVFPFDSGQARVRFERSGGRIDLNGSSDELLASMFDSLGVDEQKRNQLLDSILDWRDADDIPHLYGAEVDSYPQTGNVEDRSRTLPRNAPFQSVDELLQVKNMTPELFYGSFIVETSTGRYRRIPGIRELVTVESGKGLVDVNEATLEVLMALPGMEMDLAQQIVEGRKAKPFSGAADLADRIFRMKEQASLQYLSYGGAPTTTLISRATVFSSGASRTVRLHFTRYQRTQILSLVPMVSRRIDEVRFGRWQFQ